jgi:hypothetical protein
VFVVVRHPDVDTPGVIPVAALEYQRLRGWYRVSEERDEPAAFHLPDFAEAPDLDAPKSKKSPAKPESGEEQ